MKKRNLKNLIITTVALVAAASVFYFLPIPFAVYEKTQGSSVRPLGEILPANPLNQCATDISDFGKYSDLDLQLYLATYGRINTSHYTLQVFVLNGTEKMVMYEDVFSASGLADNSYVNFEFAPRATTPGRLCFTLASVDATPGNAVTVWLNAQSDPVFRITASRPLYQLLDLLAGRNVFGLGRGALFGIFFVYLLAQIWLIIYLAFTAYELEKNPKPAHRKGAR